jgi:hypothetical protein
LGFVMRAGTFCVLDFLSRISRKHTKLMLVPDATMSKSSVMDGQAGKAAVAPTALRRLPGDREQLKIGWLVRNWQHVWVFLGLVRAFASLLRVWQTKLIIARSVYRRVEVAVDASFQKNIWVE